MRPLTPEERAALLWVARQALEMHLRGHSSGSPPEIPPSLQEQGAAFVTLRSAGGLRGCVGSLEPTKPLLDTVAHCAISAATSDPRFSPVDSPELGGLTIEISVLSSLQRLEDVSQFLLGTHGVCVKAGRNRGVLLPQVAAEQGWDRETFLDFACQKARLAAGAWRQGAELHIFTAEVFSEADPPGASAA
jgi:hypothetical protein